MTNFSGMKKAGSIDAISAINSSSKNQQMAQQHNNQQVSNSQCGMAIDSSTVSLINKLFEELFVILPAHRLAFDETESLGKTKVSWVKAFIAARIVDWAQIEFGVNKLRVSGGRFFPSSGEFIALCTPTAEEYGLPSLDAALESAVKIALSRSYAAQANRVVHDAACAMGFATLRSGREQDIKKLFKEYYAQSVKKYSTGQPLRELPVYAKALPAPVATEQSKQRGIAKSRAALGI